MNTFKIIHNYTHTHTHKRTSLSLFMMCQPPCRCRRGPRLACANAENSHLDAESDRNVKIFGVFGKIHFESVRLWYRFEKNRKSILNGFSGGSDL